MVLLLDSVTLVVGKKVGKSFAINGRIEKSEAHMMAVYTSTIDQMIRSTSSPDTKVNPLV